MGGNTMIEWSDSTFNPWIGCTKISPGCDHCYAERQDARGIYGGLHWGVGVPRKRTSAANWRKPLQWNDQAFVECPECGWRGEWRDADVRNGCCPSCNHIPELFKPARRRVFCASLADVFDNEVPAAWRVDLVELIADTPNLDWLIVTKRIGNAGTMWPSEPLPNVWLGITVCNQTEADRDIQKLLATPAAIRFLSIEPMLGPVDLTPAYLPCPSAELIIMDPETGAHECCSHCDYTGVSDEMGIDWVIVGGESGPQARPMHPKWARDLRDQCAAAVVPFLFKQWGEWSPAPQGSTATTLVHDFADGERVFRVGKKSSGRPLDGIEYNGYPEAE